MATFCKLDRYGDKWGAEGMYARGEDTAAGMGLDQLHRTKVLTALQAKEPDKGWREDEISARFETAVILTNSDGELFAVEY
jgi:hypothetical protein